MWLFDKAAAKAGPQVDPCMIPSEKTYGSILGNRRLEEKQKSGCIKEVLLEMKTLFCKALCRSLCCQHLKSRQLSKQ
jgi:hypothetical protein